MTVRWIIVVALVLATGLSVLMAYLFFGEPDRRNVDIAWMRHNQSLMYAGNVYHALGSVANECDLFPVETGERVPLGDSCNRPSRLMQELVAEGLLQQPLVCDAFGNPMFVVGLDLPEEWEPEAWRGGLPSVPRECRMLFGDQWSEFALVVSAGSDGKPDESWPMPWDLWSGELEFEERIGLDELHRDEVVADQLLQSVTHYPGGSGIWWWFPRSWWDKSDGDSLIR